MLSVTIAGASGYAGQETLDRVLAHPTLELYALGSDSLAGLPAGTSILASAATAGAAYRGSSRATRHSLLVRT